MRELFGEFLFEVAIGLGSGGIVSKMVSEEEMVGETFNACETDIEMVFDPCDVGVVGGIFEGFTTLDAEVALVLIAYGGKGLDGLLDEVGGGYDDVDVEDGLGGEAGDGCGTDMFDLMGDVAEQVGEEGMGFGVFSLPAGIVGGDCYFAHRIISFRKSKAIFLKIDLKYTAF